MYGQHTKRSATRNMDKKQHQHCFLSALLAELSWGKDSTIYPSDTPDADVPGSNPAQGRQRASLPVDTTDDSRRSPLLNLRYQALGRAQHG